MTDLHLPEHEVDVTGADDEPYVDPTPDAAPEPDVEQSPHEPKNDPVPE